MRVALALMVFVMGAAAAANCRYAVTVEAEGRGVPNASPEAGLRAAVSDALANALAQANGVFYRSRTRIATTTLEILDGTADQVHSTREFERVVEERLAGTVLEFSLSHHSLAPDGLERVDATVTICLDQRIGLAVQGDPVAVQLMAGLIGTSTASLGWELVSSDALVDAYRNRLDSDLIENALGYGISILVSGRLTLEPNENEWGARSVLATLGLTLIDTVTFEALESITLTRGGIGFSPNAAVYDAVSRLAVDLGRILTSRFLAPADRPTVRITVNNLHRANSRFTLIAILEGVGGVIRVTDAIFDPERSAVVLELEASSDACAIARGLALQRRIAMLLDSCIHDSARLTALYD